MSVLPRIALFLQYVLPRNSRNTQNLLAVYSPTDCTDLHRTFLPYILPRIAQIYTEPSCCMFSHRIHGIHRTFLLYILPRNSWNTQNLLAVYSPTDCTDFHRCCFQGGALVSSAPTRSVVALLALLVHLRQVHPLERTYLCRSVQSVGEYFQQPLP